MRKSVTYILAKRGSAREELGGTVKGGSYRGGLWHGSRT